MVHFVCFECLLQRAIIQYHKTLIYAKMDDHGVRQGNMGQILAQWWHQVASRVALYPPYQTICLALHQRIAKAIKTTSKRGAFFVIVDFVIFHNRI
jgi:hypothetical protein